MRIVTFVPITVASKILGPRRWVFPRLDKVGLSDACGRALLGKLRNLAAEELLACIARVPADETRAPVAKIAKYYRLAPRRIFDPDKAALVNLHHPVGFRIRLGGFLRVEPIDSGAFDS